MYSTCLFCHGSLGRNDRIEHFQVGRRLAFDAAKGRLWVVCPACARWNLTPLEERWEAIEECQRLFPKLRTRDATDNVALVGAREFSLVRLGPVQRHELSVWRFTRRMQRLHRLGAARRLLEENEDLLKVAAIGVSAVLGGVVFVNPLIRGIRTASDKFDEWRLRSLERRPALRIADADGMPRLLTIGDVGRGRLRRTAEGSFAVRIHHAGHAYDLDGDQARTALLAAAAVANRRGARELELQIATERLATVGRPEEYVEVVLRTAERRAERAAARRRAGGPEAIDLSVRAMDRYTQVTLDMALSEHADDASTPAELSALEAAWRDAEEIAAIADDLLLPNAVERKMKELRDR